MQLSFRSYLMLILGIFILVGCATDVEDPDPKIGWIPANPTVGDTVEFFLDDDYDDVTWSFDGSQHGQCNDLIVCQQEFQTKGIHSVSVKVKTETPVLFGTETAKGSKTATFNVGVPTIDVDALVFSEGGAYTITVREIWGGCGVTDLIVTVNMTLISGDDTTSTSDTHNLGSLEASGSRSHSFTVSQTIQSISIAALTWTENCDSI